MALLVSFIITLLFAFPEIIDGARNSDLAFAFTGYNNVAKLLVSPTLLSLFYNHQN